MKPEDIEFARKWEAKGYRRDEDGQWRPKHKEPVMRHPQAIHIFEMEVAVLGQPNRTKHFHVEADAKEAAVREHGAPIEWFPGTPADTFVARSGFLGNNWLMFTIRKVPVL